MIVLPLTILQKMQEAILLAIGFVPWKLFEKEVQFKRGLNAPRSVDFPRALLSDTLQRYGSGETRPQAAI